MSNTESSIHNDTPAESPEELLARHTAALSADIAELEDTLLTQNPSLNESLGLLDKLRGQCEVPPYSGVLGFNTIASQALCTRIAALYMRVLGDFSQKLDLRGMQLLCVQKRFLPQVFEASGFYSLDALCQLIARKAKTLDGKRKLEFLDNPAKVRQLLVTPLSELDTQDLVNLSMENSEAAAIIALGLLLDRAPLTLTGEANRAFLFEQFNPYDKLGTNPIYRHLVSNVWMLSSYCTAPGKHAIKHHLNNWFERTLAAKQIKPRQVGGPASRGEGGKPVMAFMAESFTSKHAMFRWYGPLIKHLREDYHMVLVGMPSDLDDTARSLFDQTIEVPQQELDLQPVLDALSPDIAYFPSVGMRAWAIAMANLRWAPLQIMSLGHPATSHSRHMDACLCGERLFGGQAVFSENTLLLNTEIGNLAATHQDSTLPVPPQLPDDEIHIAVPCHVMKLNFKLIAALKDIERLANKPVRYTFFPNEAGAAHVSVTRRIQSFFPNAVVARRAKYEQYLQVLNQHHLALSPFPFGNASSIIDCLILNLPIVGLLGDEPHARSDYTVLGAFGLDEYLVANSLENYVMGAVRYINEPGLLQELRDMVASKRVLDVQFNDDNARPNEIRRALAWAWQNRDTLRSSQATTFRPEGRW